MNVTVRLFAGHRERVGSRQLEITMPDDATVADLFAQLSTQYPALEPTRPFTRFSRNHDMVDPSERLADGDEVALLQPVSGG